MPVKLPEKSPTLLLDADSIMDTVREPLLVLSADLRVHNANPAFCQMFKVSPEDTVGQIVYDLGNRQWRIPALQSLLEDVLPHNQEFHDFEMTHDFPDIGRKSMVLNARRISRGDEPTEFILLAIEDLTERRRSRHFNFSHDLLCVATLEGYFVDVNPAFERVLGYARDELLSKPFAEFIHPDDVGKTANVIAQLGEGLDMMHFRNRYRCKDGQYRWFDWTCPATLAGEEILYGAARDITDILAVEEERKRLAAELSRSNADLEQFAYVASHDLQEPLRAVAGCVQIFQKRYQGTLDTSADELINHTVEGANRMQQLINDLLDYSRVNRKGGEFRRTDFKLAVGEALKNLKTSLQESKAVVSIDPMPTIVADRGQITRLIQNLVGNALKFCGESTPNIHIRAQRLEDAWQFSVQDNGIGIKKEFLDRIFVLFQRLHTRTEYPGTGIGLAICNKIVERHGGQFSVESEPGVGSTFSFTIPDTERAV